MPPKSATKSIGTRIPHNVVFILKAVPSFRLTIPCTIRENKVRGSDSTQL